MRPSSGTDANWRLGSIDHAYVGVKIGCGGLRSRGPGEISMSDNMIGLQALLLVGVPKHKIDGIGGEDSGEQEIKS
jgi:hypothetical protein